MGLGFAVFILGWEGFTSRLLDFNKERGRWRSFGWLLGKLGFGLACCLTTRKELHKLCVLGFNIIMLGYFIYSLIINTDFGSCFFLFGEWGFWSWESRKVVVMRASIFIGGWLRNLGVGVIIGINAISVGRCWSNGIFTLKLIRCSTIHLGKFPVIH